MIYIKFPRHLQKAAILSWGRAYNKHPEGAVSELQITSAGYSYTIQLP